MQNQRQVRVARFKLKVYNYWSPVSFLWLSSFLQQEVPLFSADGSVFYTILPAKQGARGEFHHVAGLSAQVSLRAINFYSLMSSLSNFWQNWSLT